MPTNSVFVIVFALLHGPTAPASEAIEPHWSEERTPAFFAPTPAVCPVDFCDDFNDVCLDAGGTEFGCNLNAKVCETAPCAACDDAVTSCNLNGGKHCDLLGSKCRDAMHDCCELTVPVKCASTESLGSFAEQFCIDHPWGRPESCGTSPPSSEACGKVLGAVEGCDITLCEYKACAAALLTAPCNVIPDECQLISEC
jgi:hypothetical protein